MGAGTLQHGAGERGIRAGVEVYLAVEAGEHALFIAAEGEGGLHIVALRVEVDGLLPREAELDRPANLERAEHGDVLRGDVLLAAEAAADILVLNNNAALLPAEHDGYFLAGVVDALVGGVDLDAVLVREGHGALGLEEGVLGERGHEALRNRILGVCQRGLGVAADDVALLAEVAVRVQLRRVRRLGLLHVPDGLEDFVLDLHELAGLVHDLLCLANDEADGISYEAGDVALGDHDVPVLLDVADLVVRHVLRRQHRQHARQRLGLGGVDIQYPGSGVLGAHRAPVDHALHLDIVAVLAVSEDLRAHVGTEGALADAELVALFEHRVYLRIAAENGGGESDALNYLLITCAAADVAAERDLDLLLSRVRDLVNEGLAGHDHAGDAETALDRADLAESVDEGLLLVVRQALYGGDAPAHSLFRGQDAGLHRPAVHDYRASTAGALAAAVLDGFEVQIVAEIAEQRLVLRRAPGNAVYFEYVLSHDAHLRIFRPEARGYHRRP